MNTLDMSKKKVLILVIIVGILAIIGTLVYIFSKQKDNDYNLTIDINPSVELNIKNGNIVDDIDKLNDDAKRMFNEDNFNNIPLDKAIDTIITKAVDTGVLKDGQAILWSLDKNNNNVSDDILNNIKEPLSQKNIDASIYNQTYKHGESLEREAKMYGISEGKMAFIKRVMKNDSTLVESELANMTIGEIDSILQSRKLNVNDKDLQLYKYDNTTNNIVATGNTNVDVKKQVNDLIAKYNILNDKISSDDKNELNKQFLQIKQEIQNCTDNLNSSINLDDKIKNDLKRPTEQNKKYTDEILQNINAGQNTIDAPNITPKPPVDSNLGSANNVNNSSVGSDLGDITKKLNGFLDRANNFMSSVTPQNYYTNKAKMEQLDREMDRFDDQLEMAFKMQKIDAKTYYDADNRLDTIENILDNIEDRCEIDDDIFDRCD